MTRVRSAVTSLLSSFALLCAISGSAYAIPLSDLLGGGHIDSDGLRFSNFVYSATGDMPDAVDVNVVAIIDGDGNYGIRFQGAFLDTSSPGLSDAGISFSVDVISGALISDAHLSGTPDVIPDGIAEGFVAVTERIGDQRMQIFAFSDPELGTRFSDWMVFEPTERLDVVMKDILASATVGIATITIIDQTFSRVPEPGTLVLLGLGLTGLAAAGRRR